VVVQVVPDLGALGGVANHARTLAAGLAERGIDSRFVTAPGTGEPGTGEHVGGADVTRLAARDAAELAVTLERLEAGHVLLHYSSYGYHERGCPGWLVGGIERWRSGGRERRLLGLFHELYATGRPWESSFWLSPVQRRLAARLARASDSLVTGVELYARKLERWRPPGSRLELLPVFSTAGEAASPAPLAARRRQLVVFGSAGVRERGYRRFAASIARACRQLGIARVLDVGPGEVAPERLAGHPVERAGVLDAATVSRVLGESAAGFVAYPTTFLGKSSIFAAYCAHGLVPVCAWPGEAALLGGPPCWRPDAAAPAAAAAGAQDVADRAHRWYGDHTRAEHVRRYQALLQ
jgi:hypothetical protein